jgi:hypothetical protein
MTHLNVSKNLFTQHSFQPVYKTEINDRGNLLRWPRNTHYLQTLALTSTTNGGRSVGIVRSRTKATEGFFLV